MEMRTQKAEVTSPIKPKLGLKADEVVGFLDMG